MLISGFLGQAAGLVLGCSCSKNMRVSWWFPAHFRICLGGGWLSFGVVMFHFLLVF